MPTGEDYYKALGVEKGASQDEIKAAYRTLARKLHPDVNKDPDAQKRFTKVQEAYDVLGDEEKRRVYDQVGHAGFAGGFPRSGAGQGAGPRAGTYTWTNVGGPGSEPGFDPEDVGSIFEEIFGAGGFGPRGRTRAHSARQRSRAARGADVETDFTVPFDVALKGGTQTVRIKRGGATQTIEVTIPKGAADGQRLRIRGAGQPSAGAGGPGDLLITLRIGPHPLYRRDGLDISIDLPLTIVEATLGATVTVPTPSGGVDLTVPPGTSSGARLRIKGRGVEAADGRKGDFYAVVKIVPPQNLSDDDKQALRDLGERLPSPRNKPEWKV